MDATKAIELIRKFDLAVHRLEVCFIRNPRRTKTAVKNYDTARGKVFEAITGNKPTPEQSKAMDY